MTNNADSHRGGWLADWQAGQLLCRRQDARNAGLRQFSVSGEMQGIGRRKTGEVLELPPQRDRAVLDGSVKAKTEICAIQARARLENRVLSEAARLVFPRNGGRRE